MGSTVNNSDETGTQEKVLTKAREKFINVFGPNGHYWQGNTVNNTGCYFRQRQDVIYIINTAYTGNIEMVYRNKLHKYINFT
jgi:hypothetical protein